MERRVRYFALKDPFGRKRKEREDEGLPEISSHVSFPSEVPKNLSLSRICLNKINE